MRQALRQNPARRRVSTTGSIPAPVKGWFAIDALADQPVDSAVQLTNWFPEPTTVRLRRGSIMWAKDIGGPVRTLMVWSGPTNDKLFAVGGGKIWDVTAQSTETETLWDLFPGAMAPATTWDVPPEATPTLWDVGGTDAKVDTGVASLNDYWSWINYSNSGGNFLIAVNGAQPCLHYNGTTWTTAPVITGPANPSKLIQVWAHKRRIWFVEDASTRAWFLDTDAIGGPATMLDLGPLMTLGGRLQAGGSWTLDGGNGPDDYAFFLTTNGQLIIYKGTNPADANNWSIQGVYKIGRPLGRRCYTNVGGDVAIATEDGVISLAQSLTLDQASASQAAITKNIQSAFNQSVRLYGDLIGWQIISYPVGTMAIVNVPVSSDTTSVQYAMNVITGAWCDFNGMNAACWALKGSQMFFGTWDGGVALMDAGVSDWGSDRLSATMITAYSYVSPASQQKQMKLMRPILQTDSIVSPSIDVSVDFKNKSPQGTLTPVIPAGPLWDIALWDQAIWSEPNEVSLEWATVFGLGYTFAATMNVSVAPFLGRNDVSSEVNLRVVSFDLIYEAGGLL